MAINLDELINRAISMASNVGDVKRKQQWDMAKESQANDMARTQLQEAGATGRTQLQESGSMSRAQLQEFGSMERARLTDLGETARKRLGIQGGLDERGMVEGGLNSRAVKEMDWRTREREATQAFGMDTLGSKQAQRDEDNKAQAYRAFGSALLGSKDADPASKKFFMDSIGAPTTNLLSPAPRVGPETPEQKKKRLMDEATRAAGGL